MAETIHPATATSDELHTSALLHEFIGKVPGKSFTLEWLIDHLPNRSFGIILLFLAVIAILPVISFPARILILILTLEIMVGYRNPILPQRWMKRPLSSRHLAYLERYIIPWLKKLEALVRPRWCPLLTSIRRIAALTVFLLTLISLLAPLPLANVPPSLISILMAFGYIEHDGLLFFAAFILALIFLGAIAFVALGI